MQSEDLGAVAARPLWRRIVDFPLVAMLIALALAFAAYTLGIIIEKRLPLPPDSVERLALASAIQIALVFAVYKLAITRLGNPPHDDLKLSDAPRNLLFGLGFGALLFAGIVAVAALLDVYNIVGQGSTRTLLTDLISAAIMPGFMEEMLFRGILFLWLERFAGSWAALVITSALFGLAHILNPNATWFSSFAIAMEAGLLLGGAYMLTRNLWMPMGLHAAWNYTQGFIFDVPVSGLDQEGLVEAKLTGPTLLSGGAFGLEASVIALIIATATGFWLLVLAVRRGNVVQPWWAQRKE